MTRVVRTRGSTSRCDITRTAAVLAVRRVMCSQSVRGVLLASALLVMPRIAGADETAPSGGEIVSKLEAGEQVAGPAFAAIEVGFLGVYRVGCWTPVELVLQGGDQDLRGRVELRLADGDGTSSEAVSDEVLLKANHSTRVRLYARFGRLGGSVTATFRSGDKLAFSRAFAAGAEADADFSLALPSSERVIVQIGKPIGVEEAAARQQREAPEHTTWVGLDDAGQLPERWYGYEGVEFVVFSSAPDEAYAPLKTDSGRLQALERWLEMGGQLVLACGADAERLLAPESPLAQFAPGKFSQFITTQKTTSLEGYSGATSRIEIQRGKGMQVIQLADADATVELSEGDLPLVLRAPRVFGQTTMLLVDPSRPPLADWQGRSGLMNRLLGRRLRLASEEDQEVGRTPATHLGITDLAGQLRGALDQFKGVELAPFWLVAGLVFIYLLLVGPLDFFLHRKLTRRMALTWLTFPFWVLLFSAGAYWGAGRLKGNRMLINQVDLVDVDVGSKQVRGTTWLNMFSPETRQYDLSLRPQLPDVDANAKTEVLWSWMGLPGPALGGMEHSAAAPASASQAYRFSQNLDEMSGVPIPVWATKGFLGRWTGRAAPAVEARLKSGEDGVAEGRITSRLNQTLSGCLLVSGRWAYVLGDLEPGQPVLVRPGEQRDLQAVLKDFKLVKESKNFVQISTPYDQAGFDVRSILQQMMFYEAGGGRRYTGLANRYLHFTDLSDHLALGQAILWGRAEGCVAELQEDGKMLEGSGSRSTFYRFVLPLESK